MEELTGCDPENRDGAQRGTPDNGPDAPLGDAAQDERLQRREEEEEEDDEGKGDDNDRQLVGDDVGAHRGSRSGTPSRAEDNTVREMLRYANANFSPVMRRQFINQMQPTVSPAATPRASPTPARPLPAGASSSKATSSKVALSKGVPISFSHQPVAANFFDGIAVRPNPRLAELLQNFSHLPLSACTTAAIRDYNENPGKHKISKYSDGRGDEKKMLDVSTFPAESTLSADEWRDAYQNFLDILRGVCTLDVTAAFEAHHLWLCRREDFNESFPGILEFDTELRRAFFIRDERVPFFVGSDAYANRFRDIQARHTRTTLAGLDKTSSRYQPYPDRRSFRSDVIPPSRGSGSTFRMTKQASEALCLCCARVGHTARDCNRAVLPNNRPTHSTWSGGKLVVAASPKHDVCIWWNLRGAGSGRCGVNCPGIKAHMCAFCGSSEHHGASKRCL